MGLIIRLLVFVLVSGVVCGGVVVFVFGTGFQVHHAWYALVPSAIGAVILLVLRRSIPRT